MNVAWYKKLHKCYHPLIVAIVLIDFDHEIKILQFCLLFYMVAHLKEWIMSIKYRWVAEATVFKVQWKICLFMEY